MKQFFYYVHLDVIDFRPQIGIFNENKDLIKTINLSDFSKINDTPHNFLVMRAHETIQEKLLEPGMQYTLEKLRL